MKQNCPKCKKEVELPEITKMHSLAWLVQPPTLVMCEECTAREEEEIEEYVEKVRQEVCALVAKRLKEGLEKFPAFKGKGERELYLHTCQVCGYNSLRKTP